MYVGVVFDGQAAARQNCNQAQLEDARDAGRSLQKYIKLIETYNFEETIDVLISVYKA